MHLFVCAKVTGSEKSRKGNLKKKTQNGLPFFLQKKKKTSYKKLKMSLDRDGKRRWIGLTLEYHAVL